VRTGGVELHPAAGCGEERSATDEKARLVPGSSSVATQGARGLSRCVVVVTCAGLGLLLAVAIWPPARSRVLARLRGQSTLNERLAEVGPGARTRLSERFATAGVRYPPEAITLLVLKQERVLHVFASAPGSHRPVLIVSYPVLAASGSLGPKLREGDRQVPEGVYTIESLNPNSLYHLSLRVGYPSPGDVARARADNRTQLGGDIMIHGGAASIGCVAIGDPAIEEVFTLVADVGIEPHRCRVLMSPIDWRTPGSTVNTTQMPPWIDDVYRELRESMRLLP
jgi:hypothetical protein